MLLPVLLPVLLPLFPDVVGGLGGGVVEGLAALPADSVDEETSAVDRSPLVSGATAVVVVPTKLAGGTLVGPGAEVAAASIAPGGVGGVQQGR